MKEKTCIECGSRNIRYNEKTEQNVCMDCGAIHEKMPSEKEKSLHK